jgi:hypothetical protein
MAAPHPRFPSNAVQSSTLDVAAASAGTGRQHAKTTVRTPKRRIDKSCHQGEVELVTDGHASQRPSRTWRCCSSRFGSAWRVPFKRLLARDCERGRRRFGSGLRCCGLRVALAPGATAVCGLQR